jgi:hypothetical protein
MSLNIEQAIIDHAKKKLSIPESKISIIRTPISELPQNMDVYYLEVDGSYGNIYHYYFVSNDQLFCSAEEDSFERLLKAERYLERKHLTADQLMILFRILKVPVRGIHTIHTNDLTADDELKPYIDQLSAPAIHESISGTEVIFFTTALNHPAPEKWTVTLSPTYNVNYRSEQIEISR